jgi:hypothetical protein
MKLSANFVVEELVSKDIFQRWGEKSIWFIDPKIVAVAEFLRMHFKAAIIINNWHTGGERQYSGFREPECKIGAKLSQHRFGRAIDFNVQGMKPADVRAEILTSQQLFLDIGVTTMESGDFTPTWTHLDCRKVNDSERILIVKP